MADTIFNSFREYVADGSIDLDSHTFKCCLLKDTYTIDATDEYYNDLTPGSNEVPNGSGYTTGGEELQNVTWTRSGAEVTFDADDVSWTGASFTARYAVIYDDTHASDALVCLIDFGENKTVTNGTFMIEFHEDGIFTLS